MPRPAFCVTAAVIGLFALAAPAAAKKESDAAPPAAPALWRISDEDSTVYLFAATGLAPAGAEWRSRPVARAIDAAETIWFEAPVDNPAEQARANQLFNAEAMLPKGATLSSTLPEAAREKLPAVAAEAGLALETLEPLKPWAAFVVLSSRVFAPAETTGAGTAGVDALLLAEARGRGRAIRYFGAVEQSLRILTDMPANMQAELAAGLIEDFSRQRDGARAGFEAWRTGDLEAADAYFNASMRDRTPALFETLVGARAEALAAGVAEILKTPGAAFVALDASYALGPGSVPERLEQSGLSVSRIAE